MDEKPEREPPTPSAAADVSPWVLAGLGMQFFVALIAFVYAGTWVDRRWGTSPLFLVLGVILGGGGTFVLSIRRLTAPSTRKPVDRPPPPSPPR
jgi:F0F1-type ATP synthase assembly protein I